MAEIISAQQRLMQFPANRLAHTRVRKLITNLLHALRCGTAGGGGGGRGRTFQHFTRMLQQNKRLKARTLHSHGGK